MKRAILIALLLTCACNLTATGAVSRVDMPMSRFSECWGALIGITNELTKKEAWFDYDTMGNLVGATYDSIEKLFRVPDAVGNLYKSADRKDRKYGAGGRLLEAEGAKYDYDAEGNLTEKITADGKRWSYEWNANGSLRTVTRPDLRSVYFEYDALGRRTSKFFDRNVTRWIWDGNTPLHEWSYPFDDRPRLVKDEYGFDVKDREEPTDNVITWVFEEGTFKPTAKLSATGSHSIITDHLGTPAQMYDHTGKITWEANFDIYGKVRNFAGGSLSDCPFRYQGQYEDAETGLYYNRFRYYDPESGGYLSQDPIGLAGNNPTLYGYVYDPNSEVDIFGLDLHHIIPQEVYKAFKPDFKDVKEYVQNVSKKAKDMSNLINLDKPFHGNHPKYNDYVTERVRELSQGGLDIGKIRVLQNELKGHIDDALKSGKNLNDYFKEGHHKNKFKCS